MAQQTINFGTAPDGSGGDNRRAALEKLQGNDTELYGLVGAAQTGATAAQATANSAVAQISPSYIDGLRPQYVGPQAVTFSAGASYIPSLGTVVLSNAAIAKSGLALAANTTYHCYHFVNAGASDIRIVTTAPSAYRGNACTMTGDNSSRYIGSFRTNASAQIRPFVIGAGNDFFYTDAFTTVLTAGAATSATTVSLAGALPSTARAARVVLRNANPSVYATLGLPGSTLPANYLAVCSGGTYFTTTLACDSSQGIAYAMSGTGTGGLYIDVVGYQFER